MKAGRSRDAIVRLPDPLKGSPTTARSSSACCRRPTTSCGLTSTAGEGHARGDSGMESVTFSSMAAGARAALVVVALALTVGVPFRRTGGAGQARGAPRAPLESSSSRSTRRARTPFGRKPSGSRRTFIQRRRRARRAVPPGLRRRPDDSPFPRDVLTGVFPASAHRHEKCPARSRRRPRLPPNA